MPEYYVSIQEVFTTTVKVKANTPDEARRAASKVLEEGIETVEPEYHHTTDPADWDVCLAP